MFVDGKEELCSKSRSSSQLCSWPDGGDSENFPGEGNGRGWASLRDTSCIVRYRTIKFDQYSRKSCAILSVRKWNARGNV